MKVLINGQEYVPAPFRTDKVLPMHKLFALARRERGDKMRDVALGTGISISTICSAESGTPVTLLTAVKLCRYYQIDFETLVDSVDKHGVKAS